MDRDMENAISQKGKKEKVGERERIKLTEEEKAALNFTPDRKGQKAKSDGVSMYTCTL